MKQTRDAYKIYLGITGSEWFLDAMFTTVAFVYRATQITNDPFQLTMIEVAFTLTLLLSEIPTGVIADAISRRTSVIIGYVLIGIGGLLQGGFASLRIILLSQIIWALGFTFISGAKDAWIADELGEARVGLAFLRGSQVSQIALFAGIPLATGLATISLNLPLLVSGVGHLVLAAVLIKIMPEEGFKPQADEIRLSWGMIRSTLRDGLHLVRGRAILISILTMSAIFGMSSMGFDTLWTLHMLDNFTFPALGNFEPVVWFGGVNLLVALLGLIGTEYVRQKVNLSLQRPIVRTLIFLSISTSVCIVVFGLAGNFWLAVTALCLTFTLRAVSMPLIRTWINQNIESNVRATVLSMDEQFFSLGETFGGPGVGMLGSLFSLPVALVGAGLLRLPVVLIFLRFLLKKPEPPPR